MISIFDGISHVTFDKGKRYEKPSTTITAMHSPEAETVQLDDRVFAEGNVENWLQKLEVRMCKGDAPRLHPITLPLTGYVSGIWNLGNVQDTWTQAEGPTGTYEKHELRHEGLNISTPHDAAGSQSETTSWHVENTQPPHRNAMGKSAIVQNVYCQGSLSLVPRLSPVPPFCPRSPVAIAGEGGRGADISNAVAVTTGMDISGAVPVLTGRHFDCFTRTTYRCAVYACAVQYHGQSGGEHCRDSLSIAAAALLWTCSQTASA